MSTKDAARARWRADLHEYGAAALRSAGLNEMAESSSSEALLLRDVADMCDFLANAKAVWNASSKTPADEAVYLTAQRQMIEFRKALRDTSHIRPGVVNNILEPSDDELTGMGY